MTPPSTVDALALRIALAEAKYIGPRYARLFLERLGSVEAIFSGIDKLQQTFPRQKDRLIKELYNPKLMERALRIAHWCLSEGVKLYFVGDNDYPKLLANCPDAPVVLYVKGNYDFKQNDLTLSIVGTRNITTYGTQTIDTLLKGLHAISPHIMIASGLAYGADILAHRKALELGMPTVAVLAHGLDRVYPAVHRATSIDILCNGALVTEYPPGTIPDKYNFVSRNRIIAGLTGGTLVVEAGIRSGSLITANLALDYGRELMLVPGRIGDAYSEGCNHMIATLAGALVSSAGDIAQTMGWEVKADVLQARLAFAPEPLPIDSDVLRFIDEHQPVHINDMVRQMGRSHSELSAELFDLELDGHIKILAGGLYTRS